MELLNLHSDICVYILQTFGHPGLAVRVLLFDYGLNEDPIVWQFTC